MEIYGYIFLSYGNERKTKISYSLVFQKGKIYRYLWDVFLMLWTHLGLGRDTTRGKRTQWAIMTEITSSRPMGIAKGKSKVNEL